MSDCLLGPGELGLSYQEWRSGQAAALNLLAGHEAGLLALQAPTGSGKSGISLGWGLRAAVESLPAVGREPNSESGLVRTLILTQRNVELEQYEDLLPGAELAALAGSIRGQERYHCPRLAAELEGLAWPERPEHECPSERDYCDLPDCSWPRFTALAPCMALKKPDSCPYFAVCPYYQARERCRQAAVVVTNYAFGAKALENPKIVGEFDQLVADEAHDLLDVLTDLAGLPLSLGKLNDCFVECGREEYWGWWEEAHLAFSSSGILSAGAAQAGLQARLAEGQGEIARLVGKAREIWGQARYGRHFLAAAARFAQRFKALVYDLLEVFPEEEAAGRDPVRRLSRVMLELRSSLQERLAELAGLGSLPQEHYFNYVLTADSSPVVWTFAPVDLRVGGLGLKWLWERVPVAVAMSGTLPPTGALAYSLGLAEPPRIEILPAEFDRRRRPVRVWTRNLDLAFRSGYKDKQLLFFGGQRTAGSAAAAGGQGDGPLAQLQVDAGVSGDSELGAAGSVASGCGPSGGAAAFLPRAVRAGGVHVADRLSGGQSAGG